jgi:hypothetical protein
LNFLNLVFVRRPVSLKYLAAQYNHIPTWFLALIDCYKIPALVSIV